MGITSSASSDGQTLTIAVQGRFDFSSLQTFKNSYENVNPKSQKYIIDLQNAEYLDSSALGMLLELREYAGNDKNNVSIINCNPDVKKILVITKLDELFSLE